jgi:hypothetical protein
MCTYSNPSKYNDLKKLSAVENKIAKKNKKINFIERPNLNSKIFDFK